MADAYSDVTRLSKNEEMTMLKELRIRAYKRCDDVVKPFVECCDGKTISMAWNCRSEKRAMLDCVHSQMTEEAIEEERFLRVAHKQERLRALHEKESS